MSSNWATSVIAQLGEESSSRSKVVAPQITAHEFILLLRAISMSHTESPTMRDLIAAVPTFDTTFLPMSGHGLGRLTSSAQQVARKICLNRHKIQNDIMAVLDHHQAF